MKKAREKWLITGRRENEEQEYHHKRKEAHKVIRNKKKVYMKNVTESIEEDKKHNTRKMYQTINQFKRGYQHKFNAIRNKKGEMVMNKTEKPEIWKEHFDKLLNTEDPKELIKTENKESCEVEEEEITIVDVEKAVRNLRNNKVP